ncbi:MAG: CASTOR/POLLUX-related putative ion channel, partial [Phycisphaerales bacterium]
MLWLAAISAAVMAVVAVILVLGVQPLDADPAAPPNYGDSFWTTLGVALDPGAVEDAGWAYRLVMLAVAIIGILIVSTIIGVLTSG